MYSLNLQMMLNFSKIVMVPSKELVRRQKIYLKVEEKWCENGT